MSEKSTMVELVIELQKLPKNPEVLQMIKEAKQGEFHDYKNKKYDCGKMASAQMLHHIGDKYPDCKEEATRIRGLIINGEYDERPDQDDIYLLHLFIDNDNNMTPKQINDLKKMIGLKNINKL